MVRCVRRDETLTPTSAPHTLCQLHGRSAILPDSRAVCTVLSLTPAAPALTESGPVGFQSWPMDEACLALLNEAQHDGYSIGYDTLGELGLEVDSEELLPPLNAAPP